ncbi:MAG TPA: hypothetical protein VE261_04760, partial [Gaiellaceae bacterium]|nr:hypothetical protein [Gaiellaceae bacterium]
GKATFFYALTREFLAWRNTQVVVELDNGVRREGRLHDVIVANGNFHGGGMKLAPEARQDDGLFDVVTIGDVNKLDFLTTAPKLYSGRYLSHPKVELLRSASVAVDAADVDRPRRPAEDDTDSVVEPVRDAMRAPEVLAGARGQDGDLSVRSHDAVDHLVHGAVAADDDEQCALRLAGSLGEVPRELGQHLLAAQAELGRTAPQLRPALAGRAVPRRRVDEEEDPANRG